MRSGSVPAHPTLPPCLHALLCVCRCCLMACLLSLMRWRRSSTHQWRQQAAHCGAQAHQAAAARVNPRSRPWQRQRPLRDAAALGLLRNLGPVPQCGQPGPGDLLDGLSAAPCSHSDSCDGCMDALLTQHALIPAAWFW